MIAPSSLQVCGLLRLQMLAPLAFHYFLAVGAACAMTSPSQSMPAFFVQVTLAHPRGHCQLFASRLISGDDKLTGSFRPVSVAQAPSQISAGVWLLSGLIRLWGEETSGVDPIASTPLSCSNRGAYR